MFPDSFMCMGCWCFYSANAFARNIGFNGPVPAIAG